MWLYSQIQISNPMRGSLFKIITFIGLTTSREEKAFPTTIQTYAICMITYIWQRWRLFIRDKPILSQRCYMRTMITRVQLQKRNLWSWDSSSLLPRQTNWQQTPSRKVILTLVTLLRLFGWWIRGLLGLSHCELLLRTVSEPIEEEEHPPFEATTMQLQQRHDCVH
jgi:hypothetical protein